jgi:hypothetical protein
VIEKEEELEKLITGGEAAIGRDLLDMLPGN